MCAGRRCGPVFVCGVLCVRYRILHGCLSMVSFPCFCGLPEDLLYLLTSCRFDREVLAWFLSWVQEARPSISSLTSSQILFGFATESRVPLVYSALLGVLRHHIWLSRNNQRCEDIAPDVGVLLHKAKSTFRFLRYLRLRSMTGSTFLVDLSHKLFYVWESVFCW